MYSPFGVLPLAVVVRFRGAGNIDLRGAGSMDLRGAGSSDWRGADGPAPGWVVWALLG
jgi:hypothetical protein